MTTSDAVEVHFKTTHNRGVDHVYSHIHRGNCGTCGVGQVTRPTIDPFHLSRSGKATTNQNRVLGSLTPPNRK